MRLLNSINTGQAEWASLKRGEHAALEQLYKLYANHLYNYGAKFTGDKELIKDCIQELFVTIWTRSSFLGNPQDIKNYLFKSFRLAIFKKTSLLQKQERYEDAENYPFLVSLSMEDHIIIGEQNDDFKRRLETTLNRLTARQREAIFLKFYENLSYEEIAGIMGISVKGSYKLMARALEFLNSNLDKQDFILLLLLLQLKLYH